MSNFENSVLEAAVHQASLIIERAKKKGDDAYQQLLSQKDGDPVAAYKTETTAALRHAAAAEKQENRRKLLVYRRQLVNGLFAEAQEELELFTQTPAYEDYIVARLGKYAEQAKDGCTVALRPSDEQCKAAIQKALPNCKFLSDGAIHAGGAKITIGRVRYDETLDEALIEERDAFLQRCKLYIE